MQSRHISLMQQRWLIQAEMLLTWTWALLVVFALVWGWLNKEQDYLSAENGLGYILGIVGASLMLLLLSYSLRKRLRALRGLFSVKFWFRLHMILGVLGPLCILYHANFRLGSLNSTVALICMLLVAGSGLAGRYLYTKIHYGLYGEKIRLQQVAAGIGEMKTTMLELAITTKQKSMVEKLFSGANVLLEQLSQPSTKLSTKYKREKFSQFSNTFRKLLQHIEQSYDEKNKNHIESRKIETRKKAFNTLKDRIHVQSQFLMSALKKLPGLELSERLFSLWHVVHIPIFLLMILTAVTHVVVVHMY